MFFYVNDNGERGTLEKLKGYSTLMYIWWTVYFWHFGRQTEWIRALIAFNSEFGRVANTFQCWLTHLKIRRIQFWAVVTQLLWKMEAMGYLAAFLDCLSHSHYADIGDRCQLYCQRPHHSLQPPPPTPHLHLPTTHYCCWKCSILYMNHAAAVTAPWPQPN